MEPPTRPADAAVPGVRIDWAIAAAEYATTEANRLTAEQYAALAETLREARAHPAVFLGPHAPAHGADAAEFAVRAAVADLAVRLRRSERLIRTRAHHAEALSERAPSVWAAFRRGEIAPENASLVAELATPLPPDVWAEFDRRVLELATTLPPARFRPRATALRDRLEERPLAERHEEARAARGVWVEPGRDGMCWLTAHLPAETAAIGEALGGITTSPGVPDVETGSGPLGTAALSVVRISGNAFACGQNQSGSGVVVAPDRIVTNAHVVAGVDSPVVEAPNGQTVEGRVVYFDPVDDLAVLATDGLSSAALPLSAPLAVGDDAVVDGYPYGGPFVTGGARVLAVSTSPVDDIYGASRSDREVYTLAAVVEPGNSGGPLITTAGELAGIVFAESANDPQLGYAMTNTEVAPVVQAAAGLRDRVSPGACTRG